MISVIFATHNRSAHVRRILDSFREAKPPLRHSWELLVVNNNSSDGTAAVIEEFSRTSDLPVRVLFESRQGKAVAINSGIVASTGDVLAFTDDDVVVDPSYLWGIESAIESHDAIGFGGKVIAVWPVAPPAWLSNGSELRATNSGVVAYDMGDTVRELRPGIRPPAGANFFFRRKAFERYGLFREDLGPNAKRPLYSDDTEFVERLRSGGERLLYIPDVVVYHPVPEARLRKRYGIQWNFRAGRSAARMEGRPPGSASLFRVPRYLFRMFLGAAGSRLAVSFRGTPRARFEKTQEIIYRAGMIYEYSRLPRDFDPRAEVRRAGWALGSNPTE